VSFFFFYFGSKTGQDEYICSTAAINSSRFIEHQLVGVFHLIETCFSFLFLFIFMNNQIYLALAYLNGVSANAAKM